MSGRRSAGMRRSVSAVAAAVWRRNRTRSARVFSGTGTESCTARRSGASNRRPRYFSHRKGTTTGPRLTHTLEVSQIARTIARALRLNEDLTEAIALGHDLGHTPFGHAGERALNRLCPDGFTHYRQSLRVVDYLEKDGKGLNLSWEVRKRHYHPYHRHLGPHTGRLCGAPGGSHRLFEPRH